MHRICANCGTKTGPFNSIRIFFDSVWICKNIKGAPNRIMECVERREKIDRDKYKEQFHAYA